MAGKKYVSGVIIVMICAAIAVVTSRITSGEVGIISRGIFGGSGLLSIIGFGYIIQAFTHEE
jgi:hypothetical protein